ncbi:MAG: xanthine dehydrogenase family protein subunit M [Acidobacteria bacterium]|nr:xanthine dehydrogenase family protein subunit M [Acidobacteriota bacterium]
MRSYLPDYELKRARTLDDALALMASAPGEWRPLAGGTDIMVVLEAGALSHHRFVSIWGLEELQGIDVQDGDVSLGALTTYTDVLEHPVLRDEFPLLCQAAAETGGVATQNRGTIGGNIANASPAADTPPALLVYDAELELVSTAGTRRVRYAAFHGGYKQMDLRPGELIQRVRLPRGRAGWRQQYRKVGTRKAQAISKVCFAAAARIDGARVTDIRVAFGSVAPFVVRCTHVEAAVKGLDVAAAAAPALAALENDIAPIDDVRSSASYRLSVAKNLLADFLSHEITRVHTDGA